MIVPPPGWDVEVQRGIVQLTLPSGGARISYRERVRRLVPVRELFEAKMALESDFRAARVGPIEPLVTNEGEHAAFVIVDGLMAGRPAQHAFGFVFLDDSFARLHGVAYREELFAPVAATVRALLLDDTHSMWLRRRRALYTPPPGWTGRSIGLFVAQWLAPDFPRSHTSLLVLPALPRVLAQEEGVELLRRELSLPWQTEGIQGPIDVSALAFEGKMWRVYGRADGVPLDREVLILTDDHYLYTMLVEGPADDERRARQVLDQVSASLKPIPALVRAAASAASHWTE